MTDSSTKKPLGVTGTGSAGSYLMVPVSQLDDVRKLLDADRIPYWIDDLAISIDGEPEVTTITFRPGIDPQVVQRLLDSVP